MKAAEGKLGRVFVLRLEDGDVVPQCIEKYAEEKGVTAGCVIMTGDVGSGRLVVGPKTSGLKNPEPMVLPFDSVHEVVAAGTIAPDAAGKPVLHIHGALGRAGQTMTGCLREGVKTWLVAEVVLIEILNINIARLKDDESGFTLLKVLK